LSDKGEKVFQADRETVEKLREIKNPPSTLPDLIDALVAADKSLAETAISDATGAGGDTKKLAEAQDELQKAANELVKDHQAPAIEHYGHAWKKAQEALKEADRPGQET
jgi:hypothetical protein